MITLCRGRYQARHRRQLPRISRPPKACATWPFMATPRPRLRAFDALCGHVLVEEQHTGGSSAASASCLWRTDEIGRSYAAQYYELSALRAYPGPMVEMGRFCIHPDSRDPDILRVAWGAMTAYVDAAGVEMLFGCASFAGHRTREPTSTPSPC